MGKHCVCQEKQSLGSHLRVIYRVTPQAAKSEFVKKNAVDKIFEIIPLKVATLTSSQ